MCVCPWQVPVTLAGVFKSVYLCTCMQEAFCSGPTVGGVLCTAVHMDVASSSCG
jgi:hypothetical protein